MRSQDVYMKRIVCSAEMNNRHIHDIDVVGMKGRYKSDVLNRSKAE